jgi:hypothetical protein
MIETGTFFAGISEVSMQWRNMMLLEIKLKRVAAL